MFSLSDLLSTLQGPFYSEGADTLSQEVWYRHTQSLPHETYHVAVACAGEAAVFTLHCCHVYCRIRSISKAQG